MNVGAPHFNMGKLEIRNLSCLRNERRLFSGLNLTLSAGSVVFLEGQNGSGKTSLLRILCGFRQQDEGELIWNERTISPDSDYFHNISYIGHFNGIKDELSVEENLNLMRSLAVASDINLEAVLRKIGLLKQADVITRQLSAGQKRKLSLARLMMTKNSLWVLDEPFTSLDKDSVQFFESLIKEHINKGGMLILTSHHDIDLTGLPVNHFDLAGYA